MGQHLKYSKFIYHGDHLDCLNRLRKKTRCATSIALNLNTMAFESRDLEASPTSATCEGSIDPAELWPASLASLSMKPRDKAPG